MCNSKVNCLGEFFLNTLTYKVHSLPRFLQFTISFLISYQNCILILVLIYDSRFRGLNKLKYI